MTKATFMKRLAVALAVGVSLTACDGGDSYDAPTVPPAAITEVPASASASSRAYSEFAASLARSESAEGLGLNLVVTPPLSETDEPIAVS